MSAVRTVREMRIRDLIGELDRASKVLAAAYDAIDARTVLLTLFPRPTTADAMTIAEYRRGEVADAMGAVDAAAEFLHALNCTEIERSLK